MKVVGISDLHGQLPLALPEADILVIAGDICPRSNHDPHFQARWLREVFVPWVKGQPAKSSVLVAGNHDFIFQTAPALLPKDLGCTYLEDSGAEFDGLKVWGTPWQPVFYDWAFNATEKCLEERWKLIPDDTELLVLHGPPRGYGDLAPRRQILADHEELWPEGVRVGSVSLLKRIKQIRPKAAIYGHIHEGHGIYDCDGITLANVAMLDGQYRPIHSPTVLCI